MTKPLLQKTMSDFDKFFYSSEEEWAKVSDFVTPKDTRTDEEIAKGEVQADEAVEQKNFEKI